MNDVLDKLGSDKNVEVKEDGETSFSSSFTFANARFGLSLGFVF